MNYIETDPRWSAPTAMSIEYEVADFLYGLIRLAKPKNVLETGCGDGHSTFAIARALKENGEGIILTCDTDQEKCEAIAESEHGNIRVFSCEGIKLAGKTEEVDFAFLDSSGNRAREAELLRLTKDAVVVLHDARRTEYARVFRIFESAMFFDTPRGLVLFKGKKENLTL